MTQQWREGSCVIKTGGDYRFEGTVVSAFQKLGGQWRYVVEDERGLLFIFNGTALTGRPIQAATPRQHDWVKSTLGHGETMCSVCKGTNRELAVLGKLNVCEP